VSFVHPQGICESKQVGEGTRIWAFAHVLPGAVLGRDCNVCDHVFIENDVKVGDRVTIKSGVQLWDGVELESDVFVGPNATFTNDRFPRSKVYPEKWPRTVVKKGASIGANATILPGVIIGSGAMVGAGAVVTKNVPALAIVKGNPARISGYVEAGVAHEVGDTRRPQPSVAPTRTPTRVKGVQVLQFGVHTDMRGDLAVGEIERDLPFIPKRFFVVYNVPNEKVRGEHAHHRCHQAVVCISGSCHLVVDDGVNREEIVLSHPGVGVHLPPLTWGTQYRYSSNGVLLVFASHSYDATDYIRDYDDFVRIVKGTGPQS
jgi:UDP-2-acetamido-3-amino-2,3-dideoxy-glucuronate N-acetyltransferase